MSVFSEFRLDSSPAAAHARQLAEQQDARMRAAALRQQNEFTTWELHQLLPFAWLVGRARAKYQGPPLWEKAPAALHIQLQEAVGFTVGRKAYTRRVGDWLCSAAIDEASGELRYTPDEVRELQHCDGTGGPASYYLPAPNCKKCLALAAKLTPAPEPSPIKLGTSGKG